MTLKAPFPYFGGKSRVADIVWDRFGDVDNYVEPFAGSLAVLLMRPTPPHTETVNDLDCYLANFWRALAADPEGVAEWADWPVNEADLHARHVWLTNQLEFRERIKHEPFFFDVKIAGWWVWGISQWIGSGWCVHPEWTGRTNAGRRPQGISANIPDKMPRAGVAGIHSKIPVLRHDGQGIHRQLPVLRHDGQGIHRRSLNGPTPQRPHLSGSGMGIHCGQSSNNLFTYFEALANRLRRVRVCCGDWTRVLGPSVTYLHGTTAMFLDPPYDMRIAQPDNADAIYNFHDNNLSTAVRDWALANGNNPLMRICLAGYDDEHGPHMPSDWECVAWKANGGYANLREENENAWRERLWFSPHCLLPQDSLFHVSNTGEFDYAPDSNGSADTRETEVNCLSEYPSMGWPEVGELD